MGYDEKYLRWSLGYAIAGMGLGIFMAVSHSDAQTDTHSHVLLAGFVLSFIYGVIHKLWLGELRSGVAKTQFILHQAGAVTMTFGLLLLYGDIAPEALLAPFLAVGSLAVFMGAVLMLYMVSKSATTVRT